MTMKTTLSVLAMAGALLLTPATAHAQWTVSTLAGANTGADAPRTSPAFGATVGWTGRWIGAEADFGYAPEFFSQTGFTTERRVITVMANAVAPLRGIGSDTFVPYASGGVGLIRPTLAESGGLASLETNKLGWNLGAGASVFANDTIGVRGDVRYSARSARATATRIRSASTCPRSISGAWAAGSSCGSDYLPRSSARRAADSARCSTGSIGGSLRSIR